MKANCLSSIVFVGVLMFGGCFREHGSKETKRVAKERKQADASKSTPTPDPKTRPVLENENGEKAMRTPTGINEQAAIAIAKSEVMKRGWKDCELKNAEFDGSRWFVLLERIPWVPGGHAGVEISPEGKVVNYIAGK